MATQNIDENLKKECKNLIEKIESGVSELSKGKDKLVNFLGGYFDEIEENLEEDERKKKIKTYQKMIQRAKCGKYTSKEVVEKLRNIYKFLLDDEEHQKITAYKSLVDDKFERETLGDELYEKIKDSSSKFKA